MFWTFVTFGLSGHLLNARDSLQTSVKPGHATRIPSAELMRVVVRKRACEQTLFSSNVIRTERPAERLLCTFPLLSLASQTYTWSQVN
ncbi:uncharacterized protein K441DRAFT_666348 [Cenococcum geophilum 1.58]|uniref:uncharacterized protein n=1 Tax=Cenococcum geophilum 1.58 TaxID=794803 RepID=UPI00358EED5F|nr:hypothetical protein K441DRAFT_666348 [Cenococcum geophilum 1.58]